MSIAARTAAGWACLPSSARTESANSFNSLSLMLYLSCVIGAPCVVMLRCRLRALTRSRCAFLA
ncbi:Uncharacterised protein [Mycobacteroides abscessus subsp. abscessus]|nr:Uncharacterised protein [Mycobacteroides abscessus subsp. abscessus]